MLRDDYQRYVRSAADDDKPPPPKPPSKANVFGVACLIFMVLVTIGGAVAGIVLLTSHSTPAPPPTPPPTPVPTAKPVSFGADGLPTIVLEFACNRPFANGTCQSFFSYTNRGATTLIVERGANNRAAPGAADRALRTRFELGTHYGADAIVWNCASHSRLERTVRSGGVLSVAVAERDAVSCPSLRSIA